MPNGSTAAFKPEPSRRQPPRPVCRPGSPAPCVGPGLCGAPQGGGVWFEPLPSPSMLSEGYFIAGFHDDCLAPLDMETCRAILGNGVTSSLGANNFLPSAVWLWARVEEHRLVCNHFRPLQSSAIRSKLTSPSLSTSSKNKNPRFLS